MMRIINKEFEKFTIIFTIFLLLFFYGGVVNYNAAQNEISKSIALRIVPQELRGDYQKPITRLEFCYLLWNLLCSLGFDSNQILKSNFIPIFSDTNDYKVRVLATLGVVNVEEKGMFYPNKTITKQEAAKMLFSTVTLCKRIPQIKQYYKIQLKCPTETEILPEDFYDGVNILPSAREAINYLYRIGVFNTDSNGCIEPNEKLTREKAIEAVLKLYRAATGEIKNPISEENLYPYIFANNRTDSNIVWGYINSKGDWKIKPQFYEPSGFNFQGYAIAQDPNFIKDSYMVLDKQGKIYFKFQRVARLYGNLAVVDDGIYILPQKKRLSSNIDAISDVIIYPQGDFLVPVKDDRTNLYGYYSFNGKKIIDFYYDMAYAFHKGKAVVKKKGKYYLIDKTGKVLKLFKIDDKKYDVKYFVGESGLLSSRDNSQFIGYNANTGAHCFKAPQAMLTEDGWFIVTDNSGRKIKKLFDTDGNIVANGKEIIDLGNGFYQVWGNNDERYIITNTKKVVIRCNNSNIYNWVYCKSGGGVVAIYSSEDTITIVDAFGTIFSKVKLPSKNCKVDFINGLLRITDTKTLMQYYYNPINGKQVLK